MTDTATFSAIDLSQLPLPPVIEPLSYEAIYAQMLARLRTFIPDFDDSLESDPAVRILQVCAWFRLLDRQRVNDAARAVMVAYAQKGDLDHLGALVGVARRVLTPAIDDGPAVMEEDDDFRRRIVLGPESFSVAGPSGAYIAHALAAHGDVLDASVTSPAPAEVVVHILSRAGDGTASAELLDMVATALSDERVRPIADRLTVQSTTIINYAIEAEITTFPGPDAAVVHAEALERAGALATASKRNGRDVTRSAIFAALHVAGVQNVLLVSPPEDIPIADSEAPHCTGITLTNGGTAE